MNKKIGKALVVGAGISGIRSALDLAESGYGVTLIDRAPHIGGILSQLDYQFPSNHCGMCKMLPLVQRDAAAQFCLRKGLFHENIEILLNTEISGVDGEPGNFSVALRAKPTWVDPELCVGCGICAEACPVEVPDAFNAGLGTRKAIYLPVPHTIPNPYIIDLAACTDCKECVRICPTAAIKLARDKRREFRILVVDDELIVRDSLKEWLVDENFVVETAESGPVALDMLQHETYHLMLTDIKMPGMDGVEVLQKAREIRPDLTVIMMTAYATVETAVAAMKIGALDYLVKPFDPEKLIPKVVSVYADLEAGQPRTLGVGSIVLCGGTDFFEPADEKNIYSFGINPGVMTSLQFERLLSGTGPSGGKLIRPHDRRPVEKIAWLQCVGSRDLQTKADFCSSICCMYAIKEALLAKERLGPELAATIFYMDMRAFGKSFERYRQRAENDHGVHFERARVHSITPSAETGAPLLRWVQTDGACAKEAFDLVVLAVGQRPAAQTETLAEQIGLPLNSWGFVQADPFAPAVTNKPGILVGGSFTGLKDIGESVTLASAAAVEASRVLHTAGGSLVAKTPAPQPGRDVSREDPRIMAAICTCNGTYADRLDPLELQRALESYSGISRVFLIEQSCTVSGWEQLASAAQECAPNRILIGACHPYLYIRKLRELARRIDLDPACMDVVDIMSPIIANRTESSDGRQPAVLTKLNMALARLKHSESRPVVTVPVCRQALVVGGGPAGMQAALAIADHGYPVDLVEHGDTLGGNLQWLCSTLTEDAPADLLADMVERVEKHPQITIHLETAITSSFGEVGSLFTTLETRAKVVTTVEHGIVILATGGREAATESYGYGRSEAIITQQEMEVRLAQDAFAGRPPESVVMIQCVDSRQEPRNYCSRVCCPTALKHALQIKNRYPDTAVYILYRDIMTPGFTESYYTAARKAGILFIRYDPSSPPQVAVPDVGSGPLTIATVDPLLDRPVEIEADLLILATGVAPELPTALAEAFGADMDTDGFFKAAESKWRPVDGLKEGVFACGLALAPGAIPETVTSAGAAAQRALRILAHDRLPSGRVVASVRHALCSLCERCLDACPYQARTIDPDREQVAVNPAMCQGCGECAATCPNGAAVVHGFEGQQVFSVISAALEGAGH
ncbi:MAG: heterodisulfide reductase, subunit A/methylviologen reducing hydrogenase, subunit delta [Olavius algarvensis Delta 4 endosymbiont]|nr:MAG: heterodisulfide reductase, subunit A/methylviologen reducing hydrogenase, subunit delta [Olavius algarvensis Delta 4 endosymbiont]